MKSNLKFLSVLFVSLLVTSCVSKKKYNTEVVAVNNYAELNQQLATALKNDQALINSQQIQISQLQDQLKVTLVDGIVFSEGGTEISSKGKATLSSIAPTLAKLKGQQIVVNGYTDTLPLEGELRAKYTNNLGLSSARADNVATYLTSKGVSSATISAQGFGEQQPVASNDDTDGRSKNRRVEIIIKAAN